MGLILVLLVMLILCNPAFADIKPVREFSDRKPKTHNSNAWGLVYSGAITENIAGKISIHSITYELNGIQIAANIYTPADYDAAKKFPAVTVAHPNGGVKEHVAGLTECGKK